MPEEEKEVFFVGIENPVELRRTLLESSRDMIKVLQRYERFKDIRVKKTEEMIKLKYQLRDIDKLILQLRKELPAAAGVRAKANENKAKIEEKKRESIVRGSEELTKLESELNDVHKKLRLISGK